MKRSKKIQLNAMNTALYEHACKECEKAGLSTSKTNTIKQTVSINAPYNSMEVFKSNELYSTMISIANQNINRIKKLKTEE